MHSPNNLINEKDISEYLESNTVRYDIIVADFCTELFNIVGNKKIILFHEFNPDSTIDMLFLNMSYIICRLGGVKIELGMNKWKYFWFNRKTNIETSRYRPSTSTIVDDNIAIITALDREEILKEICNKRKESFSIIGEIYEAYYK